MGNQLYLNKFQPIFILLGFVLLCSLEWYVSCYTCPKNIVSCYLYRADYYVYVHGQSYNVSLQSV
jgi:hypothetical protein